MSVILHLRPETERRLAARAAQVGLTLEQYLEQLLEREGADGAVPAPTFEEMTGPFAQAVAATGMSEEELGAFFEEVVKEVRAERRARKGPSP
ncbi:MAG TPA: hypothetical protein VNK04_14540 [Gemmataceae bacterium]|nr:hypothetical protein [Gemmataceae bacterium]